MRIECAFDLFKDFMYMNPVLALMLFCLVWSLGLVIWSYTPSGKRWLKSMNPPDEDGE